MPRKLKYTNDVLLSKAREFYANNNRAPIYGDFKSGVTRTIAKRFGSWDRYIQSALNLKSANRKWTADELIEWAVNFWDSNHRFPTNEEVKNCGKDINYHVIKLFGSSNAWLEKAINNSPRIVILLALYKLTPPESKCDKATPREILGDIRSNIVFATTLFSFNIRELCDKGYVVSGRGDRTTWYKLTTKGVDLLRVFYNADIPR